MLACGSAPIELPFAKWDGQRIVSSTEALSFLRIPKELIVIGGGYIGLELGSVWNRLGSAVTVIEQGPHICESMDLSIREKLLKILIKQGLKFQLSSKVTSIKTNNRAAEVSFQDSQGKNHTKAAGKVLVCVGAKTLDKKLKSRKSRHCLRFQRAGENRFPVSRQRQKHLRHRRPH